MCAGLSCVPNNLSIMQNAQEKGDSWETKINTMKTIKVSTDGNEVCPGK